MSVRITVADFAVRSMDVEFYSIPLSGWTRLFDRIALRGSDSGDALRTFPTPSPLIAVRNYMNWFCHILVGSFDWLSVFDTLSVNWHSAIGQHHKSL
jgi:hypothetical protein